MKEHKYTTSSGVEIILRPISPNYVDRIRKTIAWPTPPTYAVETFGGGTEEIYHTADSLQTDEDRAAWEKYSAERTAAYSEFFEKRAAAIIRRCVVADLPEDDLWVKRQNMDGIEVPSDPELRRIHYIETEVIGNHTDVFAIVKIVEHLSRFDEEDYQRALELFRDYLGPTGDSSK